MDPANVLMSWAHPRTQPCLHKRAGALGSEPTRGCRVQTWPTVSSLDRTEPPLSLGSGPGGQETHVQPQPCFMPAYDLSQRGSSVTITIRAASDRLLIADLGGSRGLETCVCRGFLKEKA